MMSYDCTTCDYALSEGNDRFCRIMPYTGNDGTTKFRRIIHPEFDDDKHDNPCDIHSAKQANPIQDAPTHITSLEDVEEEFDLLLKVEASA